VVSFTPLPFYPRGTSPLYPLDWRLGGPQSRSGEEKIVVPTRTPTSLVKGRFPIWTSIDGRFEVLVVVNMKLYEERAALFLRTEELRQCVSRDVGKLLPY
jgi:hypothetical protein